MRAALFFLVLAPAAVYAQQPPASQLPPSEEFKAATEPLRLTKAQPNDLTDADNLALGVGATRAAKACIALHPSLETYTKQPEELLALTRLCMFGQQYEQARTAAIQYLALPNPPEREMGLLLLAQSYLGLKLPLDASVQMFSLLRDYPYDTQIHYMIDQVLLAGAFMNDDINSAALQLCGTQFKNTLPLLETGKALVSKEGTASPGTLFSDAVRCLDIARALNDVSAHETQDRLQKIVTLPAWQGTAELAPMQSALARSQMIGNAIHVPSISGKLIHATGLLSPHTLSLSQGTVLLVPFTMWAPSTQLMIQDFPPTAPKQTIYLITSWSANTGGDDTESPELLKSLHDFSQTLPKQASVLLVPDKTLQKLHADVYPGAIVIRDGKVTTNIPLTGEAGKRMTILALGSTEAANAPQPTTHRATSHK